MINDQQLFGLNKTAPCVIDAKHSLQDRAAEAYFSLQALCQKHKIDCQLVSSYRSFERQLEIWQQKWMGNRALYSADNQLLDVKKLNDHQKVEAILTWSALPGASRHHWGTDMDVFDRKQVENDNHDFQLVSSEYEEGGPCYTLAMFLRNHLADFDFVQPYQNYTGGVAAEAWHISYSPIAVEYEKALTEQRLYGFLSKQDFKGKSAVLKHFETIYHRFVLSGSSVGTTVNKAL